MPTGQLSNQDICPVAFGERDVLQVIDNLRLGGAQRLLLILARHMRPAEAFEVLSLGAGQGPVRDDLLAMGATVTELHGVRLWNPLSGIRVAKAIRNSDAQTVHVHLTYSTILAAPVAKILGRRVVVSLHNANTVGSAAGKRFLRARILNWAEQISLRYFTDAVIYVGANVADANKARIGKTPSLILRNVISAPSVSNAESRNVLRASFGVTGDAPVILSTGRITEQKNPFALLHAFAKVVASVPQARLWFAGSGPLLDDLKARSQEMGLQSVVAFLGERNDIEELLQAVDIFCLPSVWEGLPLGLIEAMAQGLPVVATAVGDVTEVLGAGAGILVEPQDIPALAEALTALAVSAAERERLGNEARLAAQPYLDVSGWFRQLSTVYRRDWDGRT